MNEKIDEKNIYYSVRLIMHHIICAIEECNENNHDLVNNSIWITPIKKKKNKHINFNETAQEYIIPNCRDYLSIEERQHIWYSKQDYISMQNQAVNEIIAYMCAYPGTKYRQCIKKLWSECDFTDLE